MSVMTLECPPMQKLDRAKMKAMREALGLNQAKAAERAGMTLTRWSDVESSKGRDNVTLETLGRIAKALECSSADLLTAPDPKPRRRLK